MSVAAPIKKDIRSGVLRQHYMEPSAAPAQQDVGYIGGGEVLAVVIHDGGGKGVCASKKVGPVFRVPDNPRFGIHLVRSQVLVQNEDDMVVRETAAAEHLIHAEHICLMPVVAETVAALHEDSILAVEFGIAENRAARSLGVEIGPCLMLAVEISPGGVGIAVRPPDPPK